MLAKKPPMGWNSWNTFGPKVNEQVVREAADKIIELGLKECGYEYVIIDDVWMLPERDENHRLVPNPETFPSGMKELADYVHSKGLKFGIYSCAGILTCAQLPSSFQFEFIDAQTFAEWGVDYLKYDFCYKPHSFSAHMLYNRISLALRSCGREILLNSCNWGVEDPETWARNTGIHIWRSTGDIEDNWNSIKDIFHKQYEKSCFGAPGCFNDMDMLVVGMNGEGHVGLGGCSTTEYKTHFSLWAMQCSPLIIGADISKLSDEHLAILKNKEIIAINQDEDARPPQMIADWTNKDKFTLVRMLSNNEYAIGIFNLSDDESTVVTSLFDVGLPFDSGLAFELHEVWENKEYGKVCDYLKFTLPAHDCKIFKAKVVKQ